MVVAPPILSWCVAVVAARQHHAIMAISSMSMDPATSLGFGGDQLSNQVAGETDEERRRRLKALQDQLGTTGSIFGRQQAGPGSIFGAGSGRGGFASNLFGSYGR